MTDWIKKQRECPVCLGLGKVQPRFGSSPWMVPCECQPHTPTQYEEAKQQKERIMFRDKPQYYKCDPLWDRIPNHMREGMANWIDHGVLGEGSFLEALFSNDLRRTFEKADDINSMCIRNYMLFLYNVAPQQCWGSADKVAGWKQRGGMLGLPKEEGDDTNAA